MKIVYSITESNGRAFWTRIGVAFVNQDGSLNVKLNCLPINGEMQIREYVPRDDNPNASLAKRRDVPREEPRYVDDDDWG